MTVETAVPETEAVDARYRDLDCWPVATAAAALWEAQLAAVAAVRDGLPAIAAAVAAAAALLARGGRLVYVGAGSSGRIAALDAAELPPTFDWPEHRAIVLLAGGPLAAAAASEGAEDDAQAGAQAIAAHAIAGDDVVLAVAASGSTGFTCAALAEAGRRGALTIAVANHAAGRLLALAGHPILVATGAEPLAGSTRLKAGTAQKVVLNLFSTLLMARLGRVHDGRMVDMRASNDKLRARAVRMVAELAGVAPGPARAALGLTGWRIKPAVLVAGGLSASGAAVALARHGGRLRDAAAACGVRARAQTGSVSSA